MRSHQNATTASPQSFAQMFKSRLDYLQLLVVASLFSFSILALNQALSLLTERHEALTLLRLTVSWCAGTAIIFQSLLSFQKIFSKPSNLGVPPNVIHGLPWIGHAILYAMRPTPFLQSCRLRYGRVFKFLASGRNFVIISSPGAIEHLLRDTVHSFNIVNLQQVPLISGLPDPTRIPLLSNIVQDQAMVAATKGLSRQNLSKLTLPFNMDLFSRINGVLGPQNPEIVVSLSNFTREHLYYATSTAIFGTSFPSMLEDFNIMDKGMPHIMRKLPFLSQRPKKARDNLIESLTTHMNTYWNQKDGLLEGGSEFVAEIFKSMIDAGAMNAEAILLLNAFIWGTHTNLLQASLWVMSFILTDSDIYSRIQQDVETALAEFSDVTSFLEADPRVLDGPNFKFITSVIKETLRVTVLPTSIREAIIDTEIVDNGRVIKIRKGEYVVADIRSMHRDPEFYADPTEFKADRFTDGQVERWDEGRTYSTFGAGAHFCRGQYYAMHAMRMLIILCVHLYDMTPMTASGSRRLSPPEMDPTSMMTIARPKDDLLIKLRRR